MMMRVNLYQSFINGESNLMVASSKLVNSLIEAYPHLGYQAIPNFRESVLPYT